MFYHSSDDVSSIMEPPVVPYIFDLSLIGEAALTHSQPVGIELVIKGDWTLTEISGYK